MQDNHVHGRPGIFDRGFGHVHRAVAGPDGAEFYPVYVLPPGSATHVIPNATPPEECTSAPPGDDDAEEADGDTDDDRDEEDD